MCVHRTANALHHGGSCCIRRANPQHEGEVAWEVVCGVCWRRTYPLHYTRGMGRWAWGPVGIHVNQVRNMNVASPQHMARDDTVMRTMQYVCHNGVDAALLYCVCVS